MTTANGDKTKLWLIVAMTAGASALSGGGATLLSGRANAGETEKIVAVLVEGQKGLVETTKDLKVEIKQMGDKFAETVASSTQKRFTSEDGARMQQSLTDRLDKLADKMRDWDVWRAQVEAKARP